MRRWSFRAFVVSLCGLVCAGGAAVSMWPRVGDVRTEDHNRDGQPDVWQAYDRLGRLADVLVDTNFDGRSDVHEYYERGALVRRESDRDFNDRVDLVQEFDAATRERARSIVDTDFDGTADLLVLFQGGTPVFSKWVHRTAPVVARGLTAAEPDRRAPPRRANDELALLQDPFRADAAIRAGPAGGAAGSVGLVPFGGGFTLSPQDAAAPLALSSSLCQPGVLGVASALAHPYSPRGPPSSPLPS